MVRTGTDHDHKFSQGGLIHSHIFNTLAGRGELEGSETYVIKLSRTIHS
jgi:hypothetical protein